MNKDVKMRRYNSPLREKQARETRGAILDAAGQLFIENGYIATSIRAIADEVGISETTIYAAFSHKPAILWAAIVRSVVGGDTGPTPGLPEELVSRVRSTANINERARILIRWSRQHWERGAADLELVLARAADTDLRLAEMARQAADERLGAVRDSLSLALEVGSLRQGLSFEDAVDLLWTIDSPHIYVALVRGRGWSPERYERRLIEFVERVLLADPE